MKTVFGLSIPQTLEEVCDPRRTALLVYDMQIGILSQILPSPFPVSGRANANLRALHLFLRIVVRHINVVCLGGNRERSLHAGDRHPAFADCGSTTLHRAGAHITRCENTGQAGLKRSGRTFVL
jgi:hypothetical protein